MNERRTLFIHSSTLILILVAGVALTFVNFQAREPAVLRLCPDCPLYECGWPAVSVSSFPRAESSSDGAFSLSFVEIWRPLGAAINVFVSLLVMGAVLLLSEWPRRRRASV